jgi:hypothetical protein
MLEPAASLNVSAESLALAADQAEKLISVAALCLAIELVLFKFLPDLSTAVIQHGQSALMDFGQFEREYLRPGSVHHARFLGNDILYYLARLLSLAYHSADPRLHPLRVAAGILTPCYAYAGLHFALADGQRLAWRYFSVAYGLAAVIGQYVFYPGDMPSLAFLSVALFFLLKERRVVALLLMLVTGMFRETSFHMIWFVAMWAWCDRSRGPRARLGWVFVFAFAFAAEYVCVRHFFPGPVSSAGGVIVDPRVLFLDRGLLSLTTICSLGLAALFPLACLLKLRGVRGDDDWRTVFFGVNCYAFPAWIVFYRMMNGNLSEFRMLFPALLPCIYGIAYGARRYTQQASIVTGQ